MRGARRGTRLTGAIALLLLCAAGAPAPASAAHLPPRIFPSDKLTVSDPAQITGRRVNLPLPSCSTRPSDCNDVKLLNQLDGFDVDPRVAIAFGKPIDVAKVTPESVYLEPASGGERIGLSRLVFSPARNKLFGSPKTLLREATTYRIVVTKAVSGKAASSTFTTLSATSDLVKMRRQLDSGAAYDAARIGSADRGLRFVRPDGTRTVFPAPTVARIQRFDDTGAPALRDALVPNSAVDSAGLYAFGSFLSPSWLTGDRVIPATPTKDGEPKVQGFEEVGFTLILPAGQKPAGGWPVAIFGPGITRSKYDLFLAADRNAERGIATMATDPAGHSFGPRSEASVDLLAPPRTVRFSGFGRGRDLNADGRITEQEGVSAPGQPHPLASVGLRDGLRQTALDNMALVRAIGRGADVDGDGSVDLRQTGVTYYAQSLGGIYGTMLMGVDQLVEVGALNVPGGPILEIARLAPGFRNLVAAELRNRKPGLLNGGRDGFTESTPLFIDSPITAPAQGAVPIQEAGVQVNWIERSGSPETFAPLLRRFPPSDSSAKKILYQFAFGDQTVPNPTSAMIMRSGGLEDVTTVYRNDRSPTASRNPHGFLLDPTIAGRNLGQAQVLDFLASRGATISDPDGGGNLFEVPVADPRSIETLNFSLPPATGEPPPETARGPLPRLSLSVSPRSVRSGRRTRFSFRVTAVIAGKRQAVSRASIIFAGRRVRTNRAGRATVTTRLHRVGKRPARAGKQEFLSRRVTVLVRR